MRITPRTAELAALALMTTASIPRQRYERGPHRYRNKEQTPSNREANTRNRFNRQLPKIGRNDACACGSGRKHKACCGYNYTLPGVFYHRDVQRKLTADTSQMTGDELIHNYPAVEYMLARDFPYELIYSYLLTGTLIRNNDVSHLVRAWQVQWVERVTAFRQLTQEAKRETIINLLR